MKKIMRSGAILLALIGCASFIVGCHKNEGMNSGQDSPMAIRLSAGDPSYVLAKSGLNKWNNSELYVFGLKRVPGSEVGAGVYDFTSATDIVDHKVAGVSGTSTQLGVYREGNVPYYYAENYVYDFYGYHLGGATLSDKKIEGDTYSYTVTFDGSNDLMYATTNKEKDIAAAGNTDATVDDVYSAWAARRSIQPTLVFNHALARLNFIAKGKGTKYDNVVITGVDVKSFNKGVLTVVGPEIGFVTDTTIAKVALSLKDAEDKPFTGEAVSQNQAGLYLGGDGACVMIAPGLTQVEILIHMKDKTTGSTLDDYKFVAEASKVVKKDDQGNLVKVDAYEAGNSYDFYINVSGPEEITISAELVQWNPGGDYEFDPDDFGPGSGSGSGSGTTPDEGDDEGGNGEVGGETGGETGGDDSGEVGGETGGEGDDNGEDNKGGNEVVGEEEGAGGFN